MLSRLAAAPFVAITALSICAHAVAVDNNVSPALTSPLETRQGLCCGLAPNNRNIQITCQWMYENCGGWANCVPSDSNDAQWCRHCVVTRPEDTDCTKYTWPPAYPAPVGKRDVSDATMAAAELEVPDEISADEEKQVKSRATHTDYIQTRALVNEAQSYARSFGLVTIRIIVSAINVVTYSIQNAGLEQASYEILDLATGWYVNGQVDGGEVSAGHVPNQALAKGGDRFELDFVT
ncbi:hypothetical protein DHEL01_v202112 [Diaporthe helianthi]|uniref:Uncharacterized protein n=1 Tax=Diaporthe helianthi TaxID=158607 RepID=A0A2P5IAF3_DIAHE|nr:hypothetical protein DHEL01_v202112 [Diaporthe helianthi]